ncbi:MAG: nucleoside deaminase [Bacteroidota bacterium]|nr:nucleoside deaminase [Bacteroidota bacterium]
MLNDQYFMREAIKEAKIAFQDGEIPIGAVVVCQDRIIARAHNLTEMLNDMTAHAEMQAITAASNFLGSKYLNECSLYVTVEPCVMCAGAIFWTQMKRVVYGTADEKRGCSTTGVSLFHPRTTLTFGVLEEECSRLMKDFFAAKR